MLKARTDGHGISIRDAVKDISSLTKLINDLRVTCEGNGQQIRLLLWIVAAVAVIVMGGFGYAVIRLFRAGIVGGA